MMQFNYDTYFTFMHIKNVLVDLIYTDSPLVPSPYVPGIGQAPFWKWSTQ